MKSFVIAIDGHEKSQQAADRCIESGKRYGWDIQKFSAITPHQDIFAICERIGIDSTRFIGKYSKTPNSIAAFLSHYTLWKSCVEHNEPFAIFEHDAVLQNSPPPPPIFVGNIGQPSYGKFNTPSTLGWGELCSKPYFPGAHAYIVTPVGASVLCIEAKNEAMTTDVYLDKRRFNFLQEYYPWIATADDSFTTIQEETGCLAKHNYGKEFEIVDV